jgi:putative redox protein
MAERIGRLKKAILILHAPLDGTVGIENAAAIFKAARHPKSFVALDGADHLLSDKQDAVYAGRLIAVWAGRYLHAALK